MTGALALSGGVDIWTVVGVVFIAEYVLPPLGRAAKAIYSWWRDLRDLREDLYEPVLDEDEEYDEEEADE